MVPSSTLHLITPVPVKKLRHPYKAVNGGGAMSVTGRRPSRCLGFERASNPTKRCTNNCLKHSDKVGLLAWTGYVLGWGGPHLPTGHGLHPAVMNVFIHAAVLLFTSTNCSELFSLILYANRRDDDDVITPQARVASLILYV